MIPMFTMGAVENYLQGVIDEKEQKLIEALQYEGELFVNKARETGNYSDRTGNLRSSIGYVILKDGKEVYSSFPGGVDEGRRIAKRESKRIIAEVAQTEYKGFVLIGIAGMHYAAAVESRGYDVITGSAPVDQDIKELFRAIQL